MTADEFAARQTEVPRRMSVLLSQAVAEMNRVTAGWPTNAQVVRAFASALRRHSEYVK